MRLEELSVNGELHPLEPFFPANACLLMLGSFPPKRERWKMEFYYPNFQNDMWRIFGCVFFNDKDYFLTSDHKSFCEERIRSFLVEKGIALSDTAREVVRLKDNASDKYLEVVRTIDIHSVLKELPDCLAIVTTGQKATETLLTLVDAVPPAVGCCTEFMCDGRLLSFYRMPSSSRAYPKPLEEKVAVYRKMFEELNMI